MTQHNPYQAWLGLPAELTQPNYYQLLQLSPTECTRETIVAAAKSQLQKLKSAATDAAPRDELRRLAKEIEAAANCLASSRSREQYNQQLLAALAMPSTSRTSERDSEGVADESIPLAVPISEESTFAGPPFPAAQIGASRTLAEISAVDAQPPIEPIVAVGSPGLHRRKRRSIPLAAYLGIGMAIVLLGGAGVLVLNPALVDRLLGRSASVADLDGGESSPAAPSQPNATRPSPLDAATRNRPSANSTSRIEDTPSPVITAERPSPNASADAQPEQAADTVASDAATDPPETGGEATAPAPATESPAAPLIAAVAAPSRSEYSPATIDILIAASLYSLLVGNDDVAVELFSRIDPAHVPNERADRLARFAWMADTHHRYQQWVRRGAGLVAGGENLDVTDRRTIGIVEASPQQVVFRDRGVNRRYPCELLPTDVGLALAQRAGANPDQLRTLRAAELVVEEARLAFRGKAIDLDQLLAQVGKLRTGGSESGDLDLVDEFCRLDLDALARGAPRPMLWAEVAKDGSDWLEPLDDVPLANRAFAALAAAVDATEPAAQATLYHFAIDQLFSGGDEALGLAISVPTGQFADPGGRSSLLAKIKLDRTSEPQARALVRILLDRIQNAQADGRMTLVRICRQVISKFELESYQTLLDQIAAN